MIEKLELNYTKEFLEILTEENITKLKTIIYALKELYFSNKQNLLTKVTRDKLYARIVGVWRKYIRIECVGIDFIVKAQDLQYGYIEDVSKIYKINEQIKVVVKEVDIEKQNIKISIKDLLEDPFKNIRKDFVEKGEYLAEVTGYTDNGVFANIAQGVDTVCILTTWLDS